MRYQDCHVRRLSCLDSDPRCVSVCVHVSLPERTAPRHGWRMNVPKAASVTRTRACTFALELRNQISCRSKWSEMVKNLCVAIRSRLAWALHPYRIACVCVIYAMALSCVSREHFRFPSSTNSAVTEARSNLEPNPKRGVRCHALELSTLSLPLPPPLSLSCSCFLHPRHSCSSTVSGCCTPYRSAPPTLRSPRRHSA